jgi:quercetin dioxygenase-like cupin family protein
MRETIFSLFLPGIIIFACKQKTENEIKPAAENKSKAYILHKDEGEVTMDDQGRTNIIKVSPESGAVHLTVGLELHPKGAGTLVHRHDKTEEILFVHRGSGRAIINNDTINIAEGATLFIPPGTWHGIENPDDSISIFFTTTPQGLEKLFRGIGSPPGVPLKKWTAQQMDSIERVSDSKARKN